MFNHPIVVLDLETTGLNVNEGDRVTEVAALRVRDGRIIHRFETLVNCQRRISHSIARYTHITQDMIDSAPRSAEVFRALVPFIGNDIVFAHNAVFDQGFFQMECARAGVACNSSAFMCSVKLAQHVFPGLSSYALGPLAHQLGLRTTNVAHRAGPDAELTAQVLIKLSKALCLKHALPFVDTALLNELMNIRIADAA